MAFGIPKGGRGISFTVTKNTLTKMFKAAAVAGQAKIRNDLNTIGAIVTKRAKINATGRPGPRVVCGHLRSGLTYEVETLGLATSGNVKVGVNKNVIYPAFVEFETSRSPAYPFLRPAVVDSMSEINSILGKKMVLSKSMLAGKAIRTAGARSLSESGAPARTSPKCAQNRKAR